MRRCWRTATPPAAPKAPAPPSTAIGAQSPEAARFSPFQRSPIDRLMGRWTLDNSPMFWSMDMMSRVFSPYDLNPANLNPLREILDAHIDFERLKGSPIRLFIHRHQRAHRARAGVPQRRDHARGAARLRLPAHPLPGHRDRRRALLGRRLFRQPHHDAAGARALLRRHHPHPHQSGGAPRHAQIRRRHHEPAQRGGRSTRCCSRSCA